MIIIKNTENLTGVCISGDFNDLYNLVEAFYAITIDEYSEKNQRYVNVSTRVLGLCYDLRHAYQGDREVEFVDNGLDKDKMQYHGIVAPKSNVYYKCNYLYPEMFFIMLALNELVILRIDELAKTKYTYKEVFDKNVIWDDKISAIRSFQAAFSKCVSETLTKPSYSRWLNIMNKGFVTPSIAGQYIDMLNIKYINMNMEKRLKSFNTIAKRIAEYYADTEYMEMKNALEKAAKEYGCSESNLKITGIEYPDEIIW